MIIFFSSNCISIGSQYFILSGRWGLSNGGVTYTFRNGHSVTGHGSLSNGGSFGIKYTIPLGRKRRSTEDEAEVKVEKTEDIKPSLPLIPKPISFKNDNKTEEKEQQHHEEVSALASVKILDETETKNQEKDDDCDDCLDVQPFNVNDQEIENKTLANNDFVMVVKLIEENTSVLKLNAKVKFEVTEVVKSPVESIEPGQTFTIKAEMAKCPCLTSLDPGFYVVTGSMNDENQLILSNVLMEFEN